MPADSALARKFFSLMYHTILEPLRSQGSIIVLDMWEKNMTFPARMSAQEKANRQEALLQILEDFFYEGKDCAAAILLARVYAFGKCGYPPSTDRLIDCLKKIRPTLNKDATLASFLQGSGLQTLLGTNQHKAAHPFIVGIMLVVALTNDASLMQSALLNLEAVFNQQRRDSIFDFYEGDAAASVLVYARQAQSKELAAFFVGQALADYCARVDGERRGIEKVLTNSLTSLLGILEHIIGSTMPPFFEAEHFIAQAEQSIDRVLSNKSALEKIPNEEIILLLKRTLAMLRILSNSGYMTNRFKEGCSLLGSLKDDESKRLLGTLMTATQMYFDLSKKDLSTKLLVQYSLAFIALYQADYLHAVSVLSKNIQLAKQECERYAKFTASHNPEKDFKETLLTVSGTSNREVKLWGALFFFSHYSALADATQDTQKKAAFTSLANQAHDLALATDPFLAQFFLGAEYIVGRLLNKNIQQGADRLITALNGVTKKADFSEGTYDLIYNSMKEAVETLGSSPGSENKQILLHLQKAWNAWHKTGERSV